MTPSIVDGFEIIKIKENYGGARLISATTRNRAIQFSLKAAAIKNVHQRIGFDFCFQIPGLFALGSEFGLELCQLPIRRYSKACQSIPA